MSDVFHAASYYQGEIAAVSLYLRSRRYAREFIVRHAPRFLFVAIVIVAISSPCRDGVAGPVADLRAYYFGGSEDNTSLRKRLLRRSVRTLLSGLRRVEPHVRAPNDMQRFETEFGGYYVRPPKGYRSRKSWPLHIALHGHGSGQTGRAACIRYWKGEPASSGVILACPDLRSRWTTKRGERLVLATYKDIQRHMNVRTDKVSLGGFSGGGIGTWMIGPKYPDLFSAIIPRAGIPPRAEDIISNLNGLSVYLVHGERDQTIPVKHSRRVVKSLEKLKIDHVYREKKGGHEFFSRLNKDALRWLRKKRRRIQRTFKYAGRLDTFPRIIHWLQLTGRGQIRVEGRITRRGRIVIDIDHLERLTQLDIWLSRRLVNMRRRQADVILNGRSLGYRLRETSAAVLDSYEITRDLRRVFTGRITVSKKVLKRYGR